MIKKLVQATGLLVVLLLFAFGGYTAGIKMYNNAISAKMSLCQVNVIQALSEKNMLTDIDYYANMYLCMTSK